MRARPAAAGAQGCVRWSMPCVCGPGACVLGCQEVPCTQRCRVGDASQLDGLAPLAGVLSVFGLQQVRGCSTPGASSGGSPPALPALTPKAVPVAQLPEPAGALANWTRALGPGGVLAVCFWPPTVEEEGPWKRLFDLTVGFKPHADWEDDIPGAALGAGAELLQVFMLARLAR